MTKDFAQTISKKYYLHAEDRFIPQDAEKKSWLSVSQRAIRLQISKLPISSIPMLGPLLAEPLGLFDHRLDCGLLAQK